MTPHFALVAVAALLVAGAPAADPTSLDARHHARLDESKLESASAAAGPRAGALVIVGGARSARRSSRGLSRWRGVGGRSSS